MGFRLFGRGERPDHDTGDEALVRAVDDIHQRQEEEETAEVPSELRGDLEMVAPVGADEVISSRFPDAFRSHQQPTTVERHLALAKKAKTYFEGQSEQERVIIRDATERLRQNQLLINAYEAFDRVLEEGQSSVAATRPAVAAPPEAPGSPRKRKPAASRKTPAKKP